METKVCTVDELHKGHMRLISVNGKSIVLANVNGLFYAFQQRCTHSGGPLDQGILEGKKVTCPFHGAEFNIETGEMLDGPARGDIATYPVIVKDNEVFVDV